MSCAPLTGQEPFFIVLNTGSGRDDANEVQAIIRRVLDGAGRRYELMPVDSGSQLASTAQAAVGRARDHGGVVVAAGGDGTLSAVAQAVLGTGLPFGILPQGTFNYFGRTYGIPQDTEIAARCLLAAQPQPVQVGLLNGQVFLVNASLGLYPQLLEDREAYKQRYGRSRYVALWSALVTLARAHRQLKVQLEYEGQQRSLRTPTIVVGNNALQLEQVGIAEADELERGRLVAMSVKPVGALALYGLVLRGWLSRLGDADHVMSFGFDRLTVRIGRGRRRVKVAMDGEIHWLDSPLEFIVSPQPLPLLVPPEAQRTERA
ncbi:MULTISPECIES: diacylglycerol/lipid kinase family protein [Bordetella]|uniref:Diacylglycerol kinase n=2 Tax=Bordetella TaxID=517 RepID=A0A261W1C5_9BORD|nr:MULTISPECIES: diacylglycerol kinase family protein [Bordetella]MDM9559724.1 diacylglycerol kinase family protein [Bordetella petrii]OZI79383.1 diacylglycerol kinase [Bordetella genomosp. 2]